VILPLTGSREISELAIVDGKGGERSLLKECFAAGVGRKRVLVQRRRSTGLEFPVSSCSSA